ncbi:MAG: lactate utilization protein [Desulfobacterota bacterium]|jgi:L-lactate dehydrogenase complex protein LldG|nr:lactate utilization protein [Thermodesulfobacteriota bacterium]
MNIRIELLERLERELQALQVRTYRASDAGELRETLAGICGPYDRSAVACEDRPFLKELDLGFPVFSAREKDTWRAEHWRSMQEVQVGLSGADFALADTGTLILFSGNAGGRWLSLAPPVHIALLPADRILPGLDDFLDRFPAGDSLLSLGSAVTFVSGASRTADIELNLVHGAHGPKELHVVTLLFAT